MMFFEKVQDPQNVLEFHLIFFVSTLVVVNRPAHKWPVEFRPRRRLHEGMRGDAAGQHTAAGGEMDRHRRRRVVSVDGRGDGGGGGGGRRGGRTDGRAERWTDIVVVES